jgi:hypothetical protein
VTEKVGKHPLLTLFVRRKGIVALHKVPGFSMSDAREMMHELSDAELSDAVKAVAKAKAVALPGVGAEGDHPIIDFINAHWDDILAIILKLLGF